MTKTFITHRGGIVTFTDSGLIHKAGHGAYSGRLAEMAPQLATAQMQPDQPKRGRGRPRKSS